MYVEIDGSEQVERFCKVYKKSDRSGQAAYRFMLAVEWVIKAKQLGELESVEYLLQRAELYCELVDVKFQQNMLNWLDRKTFEQSEEVWRGTYQQSAKERRTEANQTAIISAIGRDNRESPLCRRPTSEVRTNGSGMRLLDAKAEPVPD